MSAPKCSNFAPPGNRPRHTPQPNQCDLNDTTTSTQRRFVFNQLWSGHCLLSRPYGCTSRTDSNCAIDCTMSDRTSPTTVKASLKEQPHPSFNAECAYGPYELWPTSHHFLQQFRGCILLFVQESLPLLLLTTLAIITNRTLTLTHELPTQFRPGQFAPARTTFSCHCTSN